MTDTSEKIRDISIGTKPEKPREPKGVRIALSVCSCYMHESLTLITEQAQRIASLLGITVEQLKHHAVTAELTHSPEVVACYKQHDLARQKLTQIDAHTPFISRPCHFFELLSDE